MTSISRHPMTLSLARYVVLCATVFAAGNAGIARAELLAGVAKVDVTHPTSKPINDRLHVRALVLRSGETQAAIITVDAVAIGEIGPISNDYLPSVRAAMQEQFRIPPTNVIVNASHCHGIVCEDIDQRTIKAVQQATANMVPVSVGVGHGHEDRIMENRRLKMKDGSELDVRHAYSMPPDGLVAEIGPIDPEIGVLRLDRKDGRTLAVVYNFACHPIQSVPGNANTADITGFSSQVIEENLADDTVALFVQGCAGDINPVHYKDVDHPRHAEPLGNMLGLSTLRAIRQIKTKADDRLQVVNDTLQLPRADVSARIIELEAEQLRLARSLSGTSLNLKTFIPLTVKYKLSSEFPSYYSHGYLREEAIDRDDLKQLDTENRQLMKAYLRNVHIMEQLTRLNTNLALLRRHQAQHLTATKRTLDVELVGLRVGEFVLTSFPGELTVQIGLNLKKLSPHEHTFVAGYSNGYIYYAPTTQQLKNVGGAQEDSDCILAPQWQATYEQRALAILRKL
jgi:hypothetical protein